MMNTTVSKSCSWCDTPNDVGAEGSYQGPVYCQQCGHRADLPREKCDCRQCADKARLIRMRDKERDAKEADQEA